MANHYCASDRKLIEKSLERVNNGYGVALAITIAARGASPRPIGSQMAVNDIEEFQGSVSGGCIESTILTESQFVIRENRPQRISIGSDNNGLEGIALGCGGAIDIYIEPVNPWKNILNELLKRIECQEPCCLVTNLSNGAKNIVGSKLPNTDEIVDWDLHETVENVILSGENCLIVKNNTEFFLHGFLPSPQLVVGGAVDITQPLVQIAKLLGYNCTIIDPRTIYATEKRFPQVELILEHPKAALKKFTLDSNTCVIALSHSP